MVTCKGCNETKFIHYEDFREALTVAHESKNDDINNSDIIAESDNNLPKITPDMLPNTISGWVKDICERIESPFEIGAVTALTLIGSLIGNKVGIRPKARDNWTEFPNLWGMIIGKPSIKKTPVYSELYKAIGKMEVEANEEHIEKLKQYELELELYENAKKEVKKSKNKEQVTIKDLIKPQMPVKKRYATSDGTIEAIADIINANPNGLLVSRDELSGFLKMMDKAGKEGDRAFYLEGWSGAGSFTVDRIMRGNTFIPRLTLSVLGNIQPSMVKEYVYEAVKGKKADGFLQRFQLCVFVDAIEQKGVDRLPNKTARDLYFNISEKNKKKETFMGAEKDDFAETPFYRFRDDAQIVFNEWYRSNAKEAQNAFNEAMEGHLSKYPKLFTSLALIFHICDLMEDSSRFNYDISKENTLKALKLVEVFKAHAERLYSTFEVEEKRREDKADKILSFIGVNKLPISFRDITLKAGGKPCKDEVLKAIKGVYKSAGSKVIARI